MDGRSGTVAVLAAVLLSALAVGPALAAGSAPVGNESVCAAPEERPVCFGGVSLSAGRVAEGETVTLEATVANTGDEAENVTVVLNTVGPDDIAESHTLGRARLAPGETRTIVQPLDASTPGKHGLRLVAFDGTASQRYGASMGRTLVVGERGIGGPLDRAEYALGALVGSVGVGGGLGYREYRGDRRR